MILDHLNKNNLHHAYLIEGDRDLVMPTVLKFVKSLGVKTAGNADFHQIMLDTFKIEDARQLKSLNSSKTFSQDKKVFIISANNFLLEAQNSLLKIFEEPAANSIFFIVTLDASAMLKTLVSRFYFIEKEHSVAGGSREAEKFLSMSREQRINFIKELLTEEEETDKEGNEVIVLDSARFKAVRLLNAVESIMHQQLLAKTALSTEAFYQIFNAREYLRQPGSSAKTLMESVALVVPVL